MPYIQADFAAMIDTTGVCNSKKTVGVDVDASVGVELSVQAATKGNEANPFWSQELYVRNFDAFLMAQTEMFHSRTNGTCSPNALHLVPTTQSLAR